MQAAEFKSFRGHYKCISNDNLILIQWNKQIITYATMEETEEGEGFADPILLIGSDPLAALAAQVGSEEGFPIYENEDHIQAEILVAINQGCRCPRNAFWGRWWGSN